MHEETVTFNLSNPAPIYDAIHSNCIEKLKALRWASNEQVYAIIDQHDAEVVDLDDKVKAYNVALSKGCEDDEKR